MSDISIPTTLNLALRPLPTLACSRRMQRRLRKIPSASKCVNYVSTRPQTDTTTQRIEDPEVYDCVICRDSFSPYSGIESCVEHFMCDECTSDAFTYAVGEGGAFPARCCGAFGIPLRRVENLLSSEITQKYKQKCIEYYTPSMLKVYCVECSLFIPKRQFSTDDPQYTIAKCRCGASTCVGCKSSWNPGHFCNDSTNGTGKPNWMPDYANEFRVKRCPSCRTWIELGEACNHMTCGHCSHQFCFICMLPTDGSFHVGEGCPSYGDPKGGYNEAGYEHQGRGLHRDTGLNRDGLNRLGRPHGLSMADYENNSWTGRQLYDNVERYDEAVIDLGTQNMVTSGFGNALDSFGNTLDHSRVEFYDDEGALWVVYRNEEEEAPPDNNN